MDKHRVSTTISAKHWELLKKRTEKFETQQKALEFALENLENGSKNPVLSPEEQLWLRIYREQKPFVCILSKIVFEDLMETADLDRQINLMTKIKPAEYLVVWYYQKPLKECSLKEVVDGAVLIAKMGNYLDIITYSDDVSWYTLRITHSLGLKGSKLFKMWFEDLFKAYSVRTESEASERHIFVKVYKDQWMN